MRLFDEIISKKNAGIPSEKSELPKTINVINNANTPYSVGLKILVDKKIYAKVKKAAKLLKKKNDKNLKCFNKFLIIRTVKIPVFIFLY